MFTSSATLYNANSSKSSFDEFINSLLGNSNYNSNFNFNQFCGKCTSSQNMIPCEVRDYFNSLVHILKQSYSSVIETDMNIFTNYLDKDTRKLMCDTLQNLNIIHVKNICTTPFVFGVSDSKQSYRDTYLVCSKSSGFLPQFPNDSVQFSTYDMKYQSYTQLNLIKKSELEKNDYSFDFTKYFMEPIVAKHAKSAEIKITETKPFEIKRLSTGVTKNRSDKTKFIPLEKTFVFPTEFY